MIKRALTCAVVIMIAYSVSWAEPKPQQIVAQSWHGLSGLFVSPTARTIGQGKYALCYSESKHVEFIGSSRFCDRQVRAAMTYGVTDNFEISGVYCRDLLDTADNYIPQLSHQTFNQLSAKLQLLKEKPCKWYPTVAIGVRDITNDMQNVEPFNRVNNGRKFFLVASKKVVDDVATGRFIDTHLGVTGDDLTASAYFGTEFAMTPVMSFIAEGIWDSPYLNFRNIYSGGPGVPGNSDVLGRFVFDIGMRMYPDLVPGMVIDTGFVGDGSFEFSFGFGLVKKI